MDSPDNSDFKSANREHSPDQRGRYDSDDEVEEFSDESSDERSLEEALETFRFNWKQELKENRKKKNACKNSGTKAVCSVTSAMLTVEDEAKHWFRQGMILERQGKLYDAVAAYRRATQLEPDIALKIYKNEQKREYSNRFEENASSEDTIPRSRSPFNQIAVDGSNEDVDLVTKFNKLLCDENDNFDFCQPDIPTQFTHFSQLPYELVVYVLKWVVSDQLDLRAVEQVSMVCRGLYITARDPEIWRLSCIRVWGLTNVGMQLNDHYNGSWRTMFLERPRLNYNGVYISRTTYVRQGEASFQDVNYRPCYLVEYYRYLRFFPQGVVLMLTTSDNPYQSLQKLRKVKPVHSNVLTGHYQLSGSTVSVIIKREISDDLSNNRRGNTRRVNKSEQMFNIQVELRTVKGRRNCQLVWSSYCVHCKRSNGQETISPFDLTLNNFPPYWFSRVKSYSSESEQSLC